MNARQSEDDLEINADVDLQALERKGLMELGQLFTRLCDLKSKFEEQGDGESMLI